MEHLKGLIPFDQMTMEDYIDAFPMHAQDFINRPTFWPHTVDEQPVETSVSDSKNLLLATSLVDKFHEVHDQIKKKINVNSEPLLNEIKINVK